MPLIFWSYLQEEIASTTEKEPIWIQLFNEIATIVMKSTRYPDYSISHGIEVSR